MGLFSLRGQLRPSAHKLASGLFPLHRLLRFEPLEDRRLLANVTVSKLTDIVDGNTTSIAALIGSPGADGGISLREAVLAANANADTDTINFGSLTGTIQLTNTGHAGEIAINNNLTITGPGAALLTIRAFNPSSTLGDGARIFNIDDFFSFTTKTVAISGVTLTGGDMAGNGGAILNLENLTVTACAVSGNSAGTATTGHHGGGIANVAGGNLMIIGSTISGNTSKGRGGGIYSYLGSLTVVRSTISGNSTGSTNTGGGIHSLSSTTSIDSSTISGNSADGGGGGILQESAAITITNSTISGNSARSIGGGVAAFAGMTVRHSTITLNRSDSDNSGGETGGGLFRGSGSTTIDHTIVAGNLRGTGSIRDDISGAVTARYSLIGDNTGATITNNGGNQIGTGASPINALLGPLANDAGSTFTHALLTGSPVMRKSNNLIRASQR
jgi:predicted outer membrane repeat protein